MRLFFKFRSGTAPITDVMVEMVPKLFNRARDVKPRLSNPAGAEAYLVCDHIHPWGGGAAAEESVADAWSDDPSSAQVMCPSGGGIGVACGHSWRNSIVDAALLHSGLATSSPLGRASRST